MNAIACFGYHDPIDREDYSRCYPRAAQCTRENRRFRRRNYYSRSLNSPRYTDVSDCTVFRYSRRMAREIEERVRREAEEARALAERQRAYHETGGTRSEALAAVTAGGVDFDRPIYCPDPDTPSRYDDCRFTPAEGYLEVDQAHCYALVSEDLSLRFVCAPGALPCQGGRQLASERASDSGLYLRTSAVCFAGRHNPSAPYPFRIDDNGRELGYQAPATEAESSPEVDRRDEDASADDHDNPGRESEN